jgi:hypothetical protein
MQAFQATFVSVSRLQFYRCGVLLLRLSFAALVVGSSARHVTDLHALI